MLHADGNRSSVAHAAGFAAEAGGLPAVEARLAASDVPAASRFRLEYAHARLLEGEGRFDEAFEVYRQANAARAAAGGMDLDAKLRGARAVVSDLRPEAIERIGNKGHPSRRPVFIVGMPRSGTSLAEQVLVLREGRLQVTVSIGIAGLEDATRDGADLFRAADRAMYLAKAEGRNRIRIDGA